MTLSNDDLKRCPVCEQFKTRDEFYRDKSNRDGLATYCKTCARERNRRYFQENIDKRRAYFRLWREANPDKAQEYRRRSRIRQDQQIPQNNPLQEILADLEDQLQRLPPDYAAKIFVGALESAADEIYQLRQQIEFLKQVIRDQLATAERLREENAYMRTEYESS